jgi:uncharacterized protein YijF (DUF1287 family)
MPERLAGMIGRRGFLVGAGAVAAAAARSWTARAAPAPNGWARQLVAAAESQIGVTTIYDPSYVRIDYPGGDVPRDRGVCTDVIVRAYRDAFHLDLQVLVHEDMKRNFAAYPQSWGLPGPDPNIDHRRVPNLRTFLKRKGSDLGGWSGAQDFIAGDLVSQLLPGNLAHIAIVSDTMSEDGGTPLVIHNIGAGARCEDTLFAFEVTGHYRFPGLSAH